MKKMSNAKKVAILYGTLWVLNAILMLLIGSPIPVSLRVLNMGFAFLTGYWSAEGWLIRKD